MEAEAGALQLRSATQTERVSAKGREESRGSAVCGESFETRAAEKGVSVPPETEGIRESCRDCEVSRRTRWQRQKEEKERLRRSRSGEYDARQCELVLRAGCNLGVH